MAQRRVLAYDEWKNDDGCNCVEVYDFDNRIDICCVLMERMSVHKGEWFTLLVDPDKKGIVHVTLKDIKPVEHGDNSLPPAFVEQGQVMIQVYMLYSGEPDHESHGRHMAYSLQLGRIYSPEDFETIPDNAIHQINVIRATQDIQRQYQVKWAINVQSPQIKAVNDSLQAKLFPTLFDQMEKSAIDYPRDFGKKRGELEQHENQWRGQTQRGIPRSGPNIRHVENPDNYQPPNYGFNTSRGGFTHSSSFNTQPPASNRATSSRFGRNNVPRDWYGAASRGRAMPRIVHNADGVDEFVDWSRLSHEEAVSKLRENLPMVVMEVSENNGSKYAYAFHRLPRFALLTTFFEEGLDVLKPAQIDVGDWFQGLCRFYEEDKRIIRPVYIRIGDWFLGSCGHAKKANNLHKRTNGILVDKVIRKVCPMVPTSVVDGHVVCVIALDVPFEYDMDLTDQMKADGRLKEYVAVRQREFGIVALEYHKFFECRNKRVRCKVRSLKFRDLPLHVATTTRCAFLVSEVERELAEGETVEAPAPHGYESESFPINCKAPRNPDSEPGDSSCTEIEDDDDEDEDEDEEDDLYPNAIPRGRVKNTNIERPPEYNNQLANSTEELGSSNHQENHIFQRHSPPVSQHSENSRRQSPLRYPSNPPQSIPQQGMPSFAQRTESSNSFKSDYPLSGSRASLRSMRDPPPASRDPPPSSKNQQATKMPSTSPSFTQPPSATKIPSTSTFSHQPPPTILRDPPPSVPLPMTRYNFSPDRNSTGIRTDGVVIARTQSGLRFIYANDVGLTLVEPGMEWGAKVGEWYEFEVQKLIDPLPACEYVTISKLNGRDALLPSRSLNDRIAELQTRIEPHLNDQCDGYYICNSNDVGNVLISMHGVPFEVDNSLMSWTHIKQFSQLDVVIRPWLTPQGSLEWVVSLIRPILMTDNDRIAPLETLTNLPSDYGLELNRVLDDLDALYEPFAEQGFRRLQAASCPPQASYSSSSVSNQQPFASRQGNYQESISSARKNTLSDNASMEDSATWTNISNTSKTTEDSDGAARLLNEIWNIESLRNETKAQNYSLFTRIETYLKQNDLPGRSPSRVNSASRISQATSQAPASNTNSSTSFHTYHTAPSNNGGPHEFPRDLQRNNQQNGYSNGRQQYYSNQIPNSSQRGYGRYSAPGNQY